MALKRSMLTGMGLTEEQVTAIIEGHDETVRGLKEQIDSLKDKAGKADDLQKQLDDLKNGKDWKAEHDKVKKELDDYRAEVGRKESDAKIRAAYKKLLKDEGIHPDLHDTILAGTDRAAMKLDAEGKLEGEDKLREGIRDRYKSFVVKTEKKGVNPANPPTGGKTTRTRDEIMAIKDTKERQEAIAENHEMFGF